MEIVDIQQFFPWGLIYNFAVVVFTYNVMHAFLDEKYKLCPMLIIMSAVRLCVHFASMTVVEKMPSSYYLFYGLWFFLAFIISLFTTKGKISKKIIATVTSVITFVISILIGSFLCLLFTGDGKYLGITKYFKSTVFLMVTFVCALSFLIAAIIKAIRAKRDVTLNYNFKYSIMLLFPFSHLIFSVAFFTDFNAFDFSNITYNSVTSIVVMLIFAMDFFIIFFMDKMRNIEEQNMENEKVILKNKMDYEQVKMLSEEKSEFRKLKHDMANILATTKGFIEIGKTEKALEIISHATDDLSSVRKFVLCSNDTINTVISIKTDQAGKNGITLNTEIIETHPVLIDEYDVCRLLSNIIDNAINGAETSGEKYVFISINIDDSSFVIKSKNNYTSSEIKNIKSKKNPEHGHGVGIIREIAKKYSGEYKSTDNDNIYETMTIMKNIKIISDK